MQNNKKTLLLAVILVLLMVCLAIVTILPQRETVLVKEIDCTDTETVEYMCNEQSLNRVIKDTGTTKIYIYEIRYKYGIMNKLMPKPIEYISKLYVPNNEQKGESE